MIIVQLKGGLGNQLFQYAAAYSLAKHHNVEIKVDCSELGYDVKVGSFRNFELSKFQCNPIIATKDEIEYFTKEFILKKYFQKLFSPYLRKVYREKGFCYDANFFKASKNVYLKGYRQSEKYFEPYKKDIQRLFAIQERYTESVFGLKEEIISQNSVSIHIRRGDYANNKVALQTHGLLSESYFSSAITNILEQQTHTKFYVFSDDIGWVKDNIRMLNTATFITQFESPSAITDFYLMQYCKHNIIANSTFSWWAAYLNPNPNKIVIAPKKWFNNAPYDTKDLFPPGWILM